MNPLHAKMIEQMQLHRKAPGTQVQYVRAIADLAKYYWQAPDWRRPINSPHKRFVAISTICSPTNNSPGVRATSWRPPSGFSMSTPWAGHPCSSIYHQDQPISSCPESSVSNNSSISLPPPTIPNTEPYS